MVRDLLPVRLAEGSGDGLAHIVQQLLSRDLAEFEHKRRRAARLRGRVMMTALDHGVSITLDFRGDEIVVFDGKREPIDTSIEAPHDSLLRLLQGRTNPLREHLKGRLRERSSARKLLVPLRLYRLMKPSPGDDHARR